MPLVSARGAISYMGGGGAGAVAAGWNISGASYASKSFSVTTQDGNPEGVHFKSDGTSMYIVGNAGNKVYQYTLSTAWDVSTASYANKSYDFTTQEGIPSDFYFKSDGTKMYIVGNNSTVYQYTLSTAWDVSTGSYDSVSFSVATQDSGVSGLFFRSDGLRMYIAGRTNDFIYQYTLSSAWNISTASYANKSISVGSQEINASGVFFRDTGLKMYVVGNTNNTVYQYTLSTAWDVNTATYDSVSFSVGSQEATTRGLFFKDDGTKMYIVGLTNDTVYQYTTE